MLGLNVDVRIIIILEVLKIRTNNLIVLVTDEVDLALVTQDVGHSITKVVVQMNSCAWMRDKKVHVTMAYENYMQKPIYSYGSNLPSLNGFGSKVAT